MTVGLMMLAPFATGAAPAAPFSGVALENLTATPMLARKSVFQAAGARLAKLGGGMKPTTLDGKPAVVTEDGFFVEFEADVGPGRLAVAVRASAPGGGSDSYWVHVDGKKLGQALVLPVGAVAERSMATPVAEAGRHRFRLTLREGAGSVLERVELFQASNRIPRPPMRKELLGRRPRLLFTSDDLPAMRKRLEDKRVRQFYTPAGVLTRKPPAFRPGARNGGRFRSLGSYALSHLLEPDAKKLAGVLAWLEMATTYPHCGVDLDAEYFTEGVALAYDWLYDQIPAKLRDAVRDTIARQCRQVYEASLHGRAGGGLSFQQNHYWFAHLSLAMGAAAVCGDVPEAEAWLAWAWDRFERIALSFSPDGGFHEGPAYWDYSMPTLYLYTDLYEWCTGLRVPAMDAGLAGQAAFRFQHLCPGLERSAALEDSKTSIARTGVRLLLWEAKRFKDPVAMGMAHCLSGGPSWLAWQLLSLDEGLERRDPLETLPPARYYPDVETVFARTTWTDDATYMAFVCRPLGGHKWADLCAKFDLGGTGHNHPAQGHFVLFGRGEVLAGDPGYTYEKRTRNHNTVLVDGKGQYGDGQMWPRPQPGRAHITRFVTDGDVTIVTGDAASAYPAELGLTRFERTLVLAGRDLVVVCDRLAARKPRTFSWLLHHYGKLTEGDGTWTITRKGARLGVVPLLPANVEAKASTYRPQYIHPTRDHTPKEADISLVEFTTGPATEATFLVPLLVGTRDESLPTAKDASTDTALAVRVGDTVVAFNRGAGTMKIELPSGKPFEAPGAALVTRLRDGECRVVTAPAKQQKER